MIGHFIDGVEREGRAGKTFDDIDPWTQVRRETVALAEVEDVDDAVRSARKAFDERTWPRMGYVARGAILHRFAELIAKHVDELSLADSADMGKTLAAMRNIEVPRSAQNIRFFADHARLSTSEAYPSDTGHHTYARFEPAGVVAAIVPWNFPLMLATWKLAPALAWGNTVVLKPAEDSPASATILARLGAEAGLPPGVLNVVHGFGGGSAGEMLVSHRGIDRIAFTGESTTGRVIGQAAAQRLCPVTLELGGKGANIVFEDADLDAAVAWSDKAIYTNAGQVCLAGSRLLVQRSIYGSFIDKFVRAAEAHVTGDPRAAATTVGPLASKTHYEKVTGYLSDLRPGDGTLLTGGAVGDGSWIVRPTVIVDAQASARIVREEVFGPIVTIQPFDAEADALQLANDTPYGLTAMVFTENVRRAHRMAARLRAGTVWVNCFFVRDLRTPFGGVGDSGVGREGGTFSREFFTEAKTVVMEI